MSDIVFHRSGQKLTELTPKSYDSEEVLQRLITEFPEILSSPGGGSARWTLVAREAGVPDQGKGSDRWSVDALFVDEEAVPTFVEVKRSSDTRIRREVVGQMLDYASNAVRYWPEDRLRQAFTETHKDDAIDALRTLLGPGDDIDDFWSRVQANLRSGRIRMVFVADEIPLELQTIIEFLNDQMARAEVLAIEVRQFVGDDVQVLVPQALGMTANQIKEKTATYNELLAQALPETRVAADRLLELARTMELTVSTTKTALKLSLPEGGSLMLLYPQWNMLDLYMGVLRDRGFEDEVRHLDSILENLLGKEPPKRHPGIPTGTLISRWEEFEKKFLPTYLDAHRRLREAASGDGD